MSNARKTRLQPLLSQQRERLERTLYFVFRVAIVPMKHDTVQVVAEKPPVFIGHHQDEGFGQVDVVAVQVAEAPNFHRDVQVLKAMRLYELQKYFFRRPKIAGPAVKWIVGRRIYFAQTRTNEGF